MKNQFLFLVISLALVACRGNSMKPQELATANIEREVVDTPVDPDAPDPDVPETTPDEPVTEEPSTPADDMMASQDKRFHLIVASQPTRALAEVEVKHYRSIGYPDTRIVFKDGVHYRVSIANYPTKQEALDHITPYSSELRLRGLWVTYF
jgi:hypothetical protein